MSQPLTAHTPTATHRQLRLQLANLLCAVRSELIQHHHWHHRHAAGQVVDLLLQVFYFAIQSVNLLGFLTSWRGNKSEELDEPSR